MLRLFVVLNLGLDFSFGLNAYDDFWYVGGTAEEIGLSDSKRVSEIILSKGFTAAIGTILESSQLEVSVSDCEVLLTGSQPGLPFQCRDL